MVLEQGALTGIYNTQHPFPVGTGRGESYNHILDKLENINIALKEIGEKYKASPAQTTKIKLTNDEITYLEIIADKANVHTLREWEKDMY